MTNHRSIALGFLAAWFLTGSVIVNGSSAEHAIQVTGGKVAVEQTPVTAVLPAGLAGKSVVLRDESTGASIVMQPDKEDGKPAITWIVKNLKAGQTKQYVIKQGTPEAPPTGQGVTLVKGEKGLGILIDGKPFTTYQTDAGPKPYCWPIIGPTGKPVTRAYPMRADVPGERHDHLHHRSFWFSFDKVNGHDFWSEIAGRASKSVHREYLQTTSGPVFGEFTARVDWISKDGPKVCEDVRRMRVYRVAGARVFDFEIALTAGDKPLTFGDSKEGLFGFRVAGTMKVDQGKGKPKGGTLRNAQGDLDKDTWGKRSPWCDYFGPVDGQVLGIAVFDHPSNFRHPTYWHSRTYGLFAANPFGISYFTGDKKADGSYTVPAGKELRLNYRVYIHKGDTQSARVDAHYAAYAQPAKVAVK